MTSGRAGTVLDNAMPEWTWNEFHSIAVRFESGEVIDATEALVWSDVPLFRRIMNTVSLGRVANQADERVMDLFTQSAYTQVHHGEEELVYVGFLQTRPDPSSLSLGDDPVSAFRNARPPRSVKVAINFLHRDGVLSTETRCQATDAFARRAFSLYWLGIRVGSGIIRGSWLRGIRRRACPVPSRGS